jgi:glutamate/tyrosine decarboxylase-like PLP-dependent enzyme
MEYRAPAGGDARAVRAGVTAQIVQDMGVPALDHGGGLVVHLVERGWDVTVPLRLTTEEMRALGYRAVDEVIQHLTTLRDRPVGRPHERQVLEARFAGTIPAGPDSSQAVLDEAVADILGAIVHTDHPRFFAYIPAPSTFVGVVADFLAAGFNVFAGNWLVGAGPAVVERVTVDWLRQLCGLPDTAGGLFVSGGTMANLVAVHAARTDRLGDHVPEAVVYVTAQTHSSIRKGLRLLGFADHQVRIVALDASHRLDTSDLQTQIACDRGRGLRPFCVIATAGTTSTGAVDPLDAVADVCQRAGLWMHVDGAYGAAATIADRPRRLLAGLNRADSIALDPHKWLFQPYEAGCVLVREATALTKAYHLHGDYLRETRLGDGPLNYYDYGPQLTRSFRALKVWMSLRRFGVDSFRQAIEHGIALAEHVQATVDDRPCWSVITPAQLGIVTFRPYARHLEPHHIDQLTRHIAMRTLQDGYALVTTTEVDTRPVLRMCPIHPETTKDDVTTTIDLLEGMAPEGVAWP